MSRLRLSQYRVPLVSPGTGVHFMLRIRYSFAMVLFSGVATGQDLPPTVKLDGPERVNQILAAWEEKTSKIESLTTKCRRTTIEGLGRTKTVAVGELAFIKPDLARIDLTREDEAENKDEDKTSLERIIFNGKSIHEFSARDKVIITWPPMTEKKPKEMTTFMDRLAVAFRRMFNWMNDDFFFLKGMKADDVKSHFEISVMKEDEWYIYLFIKPHSDRGFFEVAQLTLFAKNPNVKGQPDLRMTPVRVWLRNGTTEMTYEFSKMQLNEVNRDLFEPKLIPGYEWRSRLP